MPQKTREELKVYYEQGSAPVQGQHEDLIDSFLNIVDDSAGIIQPSPLGKTLFVDANASGPGLRGNIYQPYQNPNQALLDATSGDTIILLPGEYICTNLYKPGVSYYAFPGVVVIHEDNVYALFDDSSHGVGFINFKGFAKFIEKAIWINNTQNSKFFIEAISITTDIQARQVIVGSGSGIVNIEVKNISINSNYSLVMLTGLELSVKAESIDVNTMDYTADLFFLSGIQVHCSLDANKINANTYDPILVSSLFSVSPESTFKIKNAKIVSNANYIINGIGYILVERVQAIISNMSVVAFLGSMRLTLKNTDVYHTSPTVDTYCIGGDQVEIIGVVNSNLPMSVDVITIGEFNYDTNLIII